jgi:hypothetical protein
MWNCTVNVYPAGRLGRMFDIDHINTAMLTTIYTVYQILRKEQGRAAFLVDVTFASLVILDHLRHVYRTNLVSTHRSCLDGTQMATAPPFSLHSQLLCTCPDLLPATIIPRYVSSFKPSHVP